MSADVVERLYAAFDRRDGDAMAALYAPDGHFRDPVFGDLTVELPEHDATSAHWIAHYTFSATGRPVVNDVRATFRIENGLIVDHVDRFSFWTWSRQALGTKGLLLGWTPFLRGKVGGTAKAGLDKFIAKERARA